MYGVVAFQRPTADNNYTWYRKYSDGWVEQGGRVLTTGVFNVSLPVPMLNTDYHCSCTGSANSSISADCGAGIVNDGKTENSIKVEIDVFGNGGYWTVQGYAA